MNDQKTLLDRVQDPDEREQLLRNAQAYEQRHRWPLVLGILLGAALGLFIGWSVWPVQWSNAWPNDLAPEAQANYVAAVADAYAANPTSSNAELAATRLSYYGEEVETALDEARAHFEAGVAGQSAEQIANIDALATVVGQPIDSASSGDTESTPLEIEPTVLDEASSDDVVQAETDPIESSDDQILPAEEESSNWFSLAVWLIVAFAMIAGGLFLLRAVLKMPTETDDDEFDSAPVAHEVTALPMSESTELTEPADDSSDDLDDPPDLSTGDARNVEEQDIAVMAVGAGVLLSDEEAPDPDGYGFEPEPDVEQTAGISTTIIPKIVADEEDDEEDDELEDRVDDESDHSDPGEDDASVDGANVVGGIASATALTETPESTAIGGTSIATFTAHFQRSLDDYEEAFAIEDASGYVGDCGMGVNMKVGLVDNNPEHVAVLDVWLVDQSGQAETSFHALSLVSQYGVSAKLPQQLTESTQPPETRLVPKQGDRFQVVGGNLLIDCEVTVAKYSAYSQVDGVFTECQVEMTVRQRVH